MSGREELHLTPDMQSMTHILPISFASLSDVRKKRNRDHEAVFIPCVGFYDVGCHSSAVSRRRVSSSLQRAPRTFVRLVPKLDGTIHLQTAITTFEAGECRRTLKLYSLLHIADSSYYEIIQESLEGSVVLYELLASRTAIDVSSKLNTLKIPVSPLPEMEKAARSLNARAQLSAMNLMQPNWYIADLPREGVQTPKRTLREPQFSLFFLNAIAASLPCPELNAALVHALSTRTLLTPARLLQLLSVNLLTKRRLTYAWRAVASTSKRVNSRVLDELNRNRVAWEALSKFCDGDVALLYGAWHTGWFCRRAEADGMKFVSQNWITAMVLPSVPIRRFDTVRWFLIVTFYCAYAGLDWIWSVERLASSLTGSHPIDVPYLLLYLLRHIAPYWAFRRWFDEWDTVSKTDDVSG